MKILVFLLKILLMIGSVCLAAAPLFFEYRSFRKDKEEKITYKRFRVLVFTAVYFIVVTILMTALKDLLLEIRSWSAIDWICKNLALPDRFAYGAWVIAVLLINFGVGMLFKFFLKLVRIGLKKKDLVHPGKKDGTFTLRQRMERAVLRFFHKEKWFFAGTILKFLCITLSLGFAVLFLLYQLPIYFGADWIPYGMLGRLFDAGYLYPVLSLLLLWEAYFFLAGVELLISECPDLLREEFGDAQTELPPIEEVNEECKKVFKDYFRHQIDNIGRGIELSSASCHEITDLIAGELATDERNPKSVKDGYLKCLDVIVRNDMETVGEDAGRKTSGVLVNGGFFTEFSMYFLRFLSVVLSRGDNVVFVCNDDIQIQEVKNYVTQALAQQYSLYQSRAGEVNYQFDDPIWRILDISGDEDNIDRSRVNDCSVLITDLKFLCSPEFERQNSQFAHLIDTVVFVDTMGSVNQYSRLMAMFDASVRNLRDLNAMRARNGERRNTKSDHETVFRFRYTSSQIKYVCFDDSRVPGVDRVLKNLLSVDFVSADAMRYAPETILCFYNYEGAPDKDGNRTIPQSAKTGESLGVLMSMADFSLVFGAGNVSLFADRKVAYEDLAETIAANANNGMLAQKGKNLFINNPYYNTDDYRVIVAFDAEDNLPAAVRRYASMTPDKPTLVMIFSRSYLLRDYYVGNIETLWAPEQIMRIPTEQGSKRSTLERILVRANAGGISAGEVLDILREARLPEYEALVAEENLNGILRKILNDCGEDRPDLYDYFEYDKVRAFDKNGRYVSEDKIRLRQQGMLYKMLSGKNMIRLSIEGREAILPLPGERMTQNFIVGQNMLYNGGIYTILTIDTAAGKLYVKHETGGRNDVSYQYLQDREYHIDYSVDTPDRVYPTKQLVPDRKKCPTVKEVNISVSRRPMEVLTNGYTPIDSATLAKNGVCSSGYVSMTGPDSLALFRQTYRKYGDVKDPVCTFGDAGVKTFRNGALVMSVRLTGDFCGNAGRLSTLAAAMLGEILHSMFPSVADSVAVCPVLEKPFEDEDSKEVLSKLPKVFCRGYDSDPGTFELLIIEDCPGDLGVISVLMSSGDDVLRMLFGPISRYLEWYLSQEEKSAYLYYGLDHAPACFDFEGLAKLSASLADTGSVLHFVDVEDIVQYDTCDFCGKRFLKGPDVVVLEDGRRVCKECLGSLVSNDKKVLKAHLDRAKIFLESTYGITLDDEYDFCFESTVKIVNTLKRYRDRSRRGGDIPLKSYIDDKKTVHVEYSLPSINLSELLVRELTHVWQLKHLPDLAEDLAEGHIALVAIQYLRFLNQSTLAATRTTYYESNDGVSGEGYRRLIRELLANPRYRNNPFLYLLETAGHGYEEELATPVPSIIAIEDLGLPYTPETPDRAAAGELTYFYYSRLTTTHQRVYDAMLEAIRNHQAEMTVEGCTAEEVRKVSTAILYDHPELFWYNTFGVTDSFGVSDSRVGLFYGASAEEAELLQRRMDEVIPKYLEGIEDSMSAYDVALRIHAKVIAAVDYDTIALNKQKAEGGPAVDKIDYLRSICGVFLNGKAVCEGYARAVQYLLQRCGVECAEVVGNVHKGPGEEDVPHAWNILKVDGDHYHMDATWDDSSNTVQEVKNTDTGFGYFCITTEEVTRTRDLDMFPTEVPNCTATRANYYYHNDLVLDSYNVEKLKAIAQTAARVGNKAFTFKCKSRAVFETILEQWGSAGKDCYEILKAAAKADKKIDAGTYSYALPDKNLLTFTVKFKYK